MHRIFVIFSILTVGLLAFFDAKTRLEELNIATQTPSQIEMKKQLQRSTGDGVQEKKTNTSTQFAYPQKNNINPANQNFPQKFNTEFKENNRQTPKF